MIIGEDVDEHPKFDHLLVRLSHTPRMGQRSQGWDARKDEDPTTRFRTKGPAERTAVLKDGRTVTLRTVDNLTTSSSSIHGEQQTEFLVTFSVAVSLEAVMKAVASLRDLVTFAAPQTGISHVTGRHLSWGGGRPWHRPSTLTRTSLPTRRA